MSREKLLRKPAFWFEKAQNELFRQFHYYMERENINRTQLAERLNLSKGRVSQILNGQSNFSMKTLIELALSIGLIPEIKYVSVDDVIKEDELKRNRKSNDTVPTPVVLDKKVAIDPDAPCEVEKSDSPEPVFANTNRIMKTKNPVH